jgi:hypothetical protein
MRIESPPGTAVPRLLHEATYSHLSNNVWLAGASRFTALTPGADGTRWDLSADRRPFSTVTVSKSLINNKAMLAVPAGAFRIEDLPVEELSANNLGALKVQTGPALVRYRVRYAPGAGFRSAPLEQDRIVPRRLNDVLQRTLAKLEVTAPSTADESTGERPGDTSEPAAAQVVRALYRYFSENFRYTLDLTASAEQLHPVEDFLLGTRAGHCEYFATATVLLLRAAGIPARYATGYAVQEYSPLEQAWLVRRRHSHSWAVAWIDGQWVAVDTTPAQWFAEEAQGAPWWQVVYDTVSWLWHRFSRWRLEGTGDESDSNNLLWALLPLGLILAWRVAKSRRVNRARNASVRTAKPTGVVPRGTDSEFYRIEEKLRELGLQRPRHCSPRTWLSELARQGQLPAGTQHFEELISLHYRLRFAARGLDAGQRRRLVQGVERWLREVSTAPRSSS